MIFPDIFISQTDNVRGGSSHYYPFLSFVQPVRFSIANLNRKHNRINAFFFEKKPKKQKNPDSDLPSGSYSKNCNGSTGVPFTWTSKCRCGAVLIPVSPTAPICCPAFTISPTFTSCRLRCWYSVTYPLP